MRRELLVCISRAMVWGAIIAAVPSAIQGSILKAKNKGKSPETSSEPTPRSLPTPAPRPLPVPQKQPVVVQPIVQDSRITREPQPTPPIMKPVPDEKPPAATVMDDDAFYEQVAEEIESDAMKPGIWARAYLLRDKAKWNGGSRMFHSGRHGEICRHHRARGKAGDAMAQGRSSFR